MYVMASQCMISVLADLAYKACDARVARREMNGGDKHNYGHGNTYARCRLYWSARWEAEPGTAITFGG